MTVRVAAGTVGLCWSREVTATVLPVTGSAGEGMRTICRVVTLPLTAGQLVDTEGWGRAESKVGYLVGVGAHLWGYDVDGDRSVWWRLGPSFGDNVTPDRKYLPFFAGAVWTVPNWWPDGHRLTVVLRADAHSTAAGPGDEVQVGANGWVRARLWTA